VSGFSKEVNINSCLPIRKDLVSNDSSKRRRKTFLTNLQATEQTNPSKNNNISLKTTTALLK